MLLLALLSMALTVLLAESAWALPTSRYEAEKDFDAGVVSTNPHPSTWTSLEPESGRRPKLALGLEETPIPFQHFYKDVMHNYRRMAPHIHDLPEFAPGMSRPDLPPNDPRRQVISDAIRSAFGRAVEQMAINYADEAFLKNTPIHNFLPHVQRPVDPTLPSNVVPTYAITTADDAHTAPTEAGRPNHRLRYVFGINRLQSATVGVDYGGFMLQAGLNREDGLERIWAIAPIRGEGLEGNVGVSSKGEVFLNAWIRF